MTALEAVMSVDTERAKLEAESDILNNILAEDGGSGSEEAADALDRLNQVFLCNVTPYTAYRQNRFMSVWKSLTQPQLRLEPRRSCLVWVSPKPSSRTRPVNSLVVGV